jgi:uncharacterized protein
MSPWTRVVGLAIVMMAQAAQAGPFEDGAAAFQKADYATALAQWQPLAQQGDLQAQFNLGILHDQGRGVPQNRAEAARWYKLAAEQGDMIAAYNLGMLHIQPLHALGTVARDGAEGVKWLRVAGDKGDTLAQFSLGEILSAGQVVPQDYAQAARWYEKAAEKKFTAAQVALANLYMNGQGVPMDIGKASEWTELANESVMFGESNTSCTTQRSALMLEQCRRVVPRM